MSNVISLTAGANTSLTSVNPLIDELIVGFGWDIIRSNSPMVELVPSAILCDANDMAISDEHMVFFNQLSSPDGSTQYVTKGDVEQLEVTLSLVPANVEKIVFIVYANPDLRQSGNFSSVKNAYIRVADRTDNDIVRFDIPQAEYDVTAMVFGELYRYKGQWKFRAVGQGYKDGLVGIAKNYRVNI